MCFGSEAFTTDFIIGTMYACFCTHTYSSVLILKWPLEPQVLSIRAECKRVHLQYCSPNTTDNGVVITIKSSE